MESPEELIVKENLTERIIIERLNIGLEELEEENKELFCELKTDIEKHKQSAADDNQRITGYHKDVDNLMVEKEKL